VESPGGDTQRGYCRWDAVSNHNRQPELVESICPINSE